MTSNLIEGISLAPLAQRVLARKQRASFNRLAARARVAARHRKIANQRRDFHHKVARQLVEDFDVLMVEDLKVVNMTKRARPVVDSENLGHFLPNGAGAKTGLNRSINDAGWARFRVILGAKAEEVGRTALRANPRYTSQTCHECGHVEAGNRISQAEFRCRGCGHEAHAEINAARNILRAGLALLVASATGKEAGGFGRPRCHSKIRRPQSLGLKSWRWIDNCSTSK